MSNNYVDFQNALALAIASGIGGNDLLIDYSKTEILQEDIVSTLDKTYTMPYDGIIFGNLPAGWTVSNLYINDNHAFYAQLTAASPNVSYPFSLLVNKGDIVHAVILETRSIFCMKIAPIKYKQQAQVIYSTDEQVIGKWIDGKTLYQKVITNVQLAAVGSQTYIDIGEENNVISVEGYITTPDGAYAYPIMYAYSTTDTPNNYWIVNKRNICLVPGAYCANGTATLTVKYYR